MKSMKNYRKMFSKNILFGRTDAKTEFFNSLRTDHRFAKIKIETQQADKMTENQQHGYVRDYFSRR